MCLSNYLDHRANVHRKRADTNLVRPRIITILNVVSGVCVEGAARGGDSRGPDPQSFQVDVGLNVYFSVSCGRL